MIVPLRITNRAFPFTRVIPMISLTIILIILCLKLCFASELWASGVIENQIKSGTVNDNNLNYPKSLGLFGNLLQPIFGSSAYEEKECDNFVQVILPVNQRFKRILFVTPGIAKENPQGVKETFFRLYCNLIGILLRGRELIKFTSGTFFALKPKESRFALRSCLNEFERSFGIKLLTAMIDSGPDELSYNLQQEFTNRGIELFRHPANMLNGEIYYIVPILKRSEFETKIAEYSWKRDPILKGKQMFRVLEKYQRIIPEFPEKVTREQGEEKVPDTKEIIEALEKIYGKLEEISLNEAVEKVETFENESFFLTSLFHQENEEEKEEIDEDEEYEIIKAEDFKNYWPSR